MKYNENIFAGNINDNGKIEIDLKQYLPLNKIIGEEIEKVEYFFINNWIELEKPYEFKNTNARFINISAKKGSKINLTLGKGYYGEEKPEYTKEFFRHSGWTGGDGIFSFNIKDGNDSLNQDKAKTLFVFGDTLVGYVTEDNYRTEPLLMPNNTIAYLEGIDPTKNPVEFRVNTDDYDTISSYFEPNNCSIYLGTTPRFLVKYDDINKENKYLSGYNPKKVELIFDIFSERYITHFDLLNYFDSVLESNQMSSRGIKKTEIYIAREDKNFSFLKKHDFKRNVNNETYETVEINKICRYVKIVVNQIQGIGNHYKDSDKEETAFGINKVKFYTKERLLKDIHVTCTSIMSKEKQNVWFWLQDGVVIEDNLFFLPLLVGQDLSQPEGLQFKVLDVSMIKVSIINNELDFNSSFQKPTPLAMTFGKSNWLFGAAIMANTKQAGAENPDGYVYVYGYETVGTNRLLKVARTKPETFEYFDTWEYYSDGKWVSELTLASTILDFISCEMSITPITSGDNKGKYLAIYTYNVNTTLIVQSIGDTPWGPFSKPNVVFESLEKQRLGGNVYTYNAKAHPHMSTKKELIITYNVNTYSMEHNRENADIYHPRFVGLKYTGE